MPSKIFSGSVVGLEGLLVEVETDILGPGMAALTLAGLPDIAIKESKNRIDTGRSRRTHSYAFGSRKGILRNICPER